MRGCSWRLLHRLYQLREEKNWVAKAAEELAGRSSPEKWLLREEIAETSAKGWLREEVAQERRKI